VVSNPKRKRVCWLIPQLKGFPCSYQKSTFVRYAVGIHRARKPPKRSRRKVAMSRPDQLNVISHLPACGFWKLRPRWILRKWACKVKKGSKMSSSRILDKGKSALRMQRIMNTNTLHAIGKYSIMETPFEEPLKQAWVDHAQNVGERRETLTLTSHIHCLALVDWRRTLFQPRRCYQMAHQHPTICISMSVDNGQS